MRSEFSPDVSRMICGLKTNAELSERVSFIIGVKEDGRFGLLFRGGSLLLVLV